MADIIRSMIAARGYSLADMTNKITVLWATGFLTDEEKEELLALAVKYADPDAERPSEQAMLEALAERLTALEDRVTNLEGQRGGENGDGSEQPEYPAWKPWDGISKDYQKGDIRYHIGKLWISTYDGQNVWEPGTPGTEKMWVEYVPATEEDANDGD